MTSPHQNGAAGRVLSTLSVRHSMAVSNGFQQYNQFPSPIKVKGESFCGDSSHLIHILILHSHATKRSATGRVSATKNFPGWTLPPPGVIDPKNSERREFIPPGKPEVSKLQPPPFCRHDWSYDSLTVNGLCGHPAIHAP